MMLQPGIIAASVPIAILQVGDGIATLLTMRVSPTAVPVTWLMRQLITTMGSARYVIPLAVGRRENLTTMDRMIVFLAIPRMHLRGIIQDNVQVAILQM
jgi:hypothetical protein